MKKLLISTCVIFLAIFAFFFSNIKGYYRFKQYCEAEGGLRVYEPLERNVGWLAEDKYEARAAALLDGVGFVRYTDKNDGKSYDIKYIGGDVQDDISFSKNLSDDKRVVYKWKYFHPKAISDVPRLYQFGYELQSINKNELAVRYYMFSYSVFKEVILGGSSSIECFHEQGLTINDLPRALSEILSAFKN